MKRLKKTSYGRQTENFNSEHLEKKLIETMARITKFTLRASQVAR